MELVRFSGYYSKSDGQLLYVEHKEAKRICLIVILPNPSLIRQTCNRQVSNAAGTVGGTRDTEFQRTWSSFVFNGSFFLGPFTFRHTEIIYLDYLNSEIYSDIQTFYSTRVEYLNTLIILQALLRRSMKPKKILS